MDLPTVLYRCPGPHSRGGGTYDYLGIETPEAHDKAVADGWFPSMPEAISDYEAIKAGVIKEVEAEFKPDVVDGDWKREFKASPVQPESPMILPAIIMEPKPRGKPGPKPKVAL